MRQALNAGSTALTIFDHSILLLIGFHYVGRHSLDICSQASLFRLVLAVVPYMYVLIVDYVLLWVRSKG